MANNKKYTAIFEVINGQHSQKCSFVQNNLPHIRLSFWASEYLQSIYAAISFEIEQGAVHCPDPNCNLLLTSRALLYSDTEVCDEKPHGHHTLSKEGAFHFAWDPEPH